MVGTLTQENNMTQQQPKIVKFPSIEQLRTVAHNAAHHAMYVGKDEAGEPVFDRSLPAPTLKFQGTVKLHGTNAGLGINTDGTVWTQSREHIITPMSDNAGFSIYILTNNGVYTDLLNAATYIKPIQTGEVMMVFGEWCGGNIQKGIAITQLPKMFVVFGVALVNTAGEKVWFTSDEVTQLVTPFTSFIDNLYHIYQFPHFEIEIDFNRVHDIQNKLIEMTIAVEDECPVGKQLGGNMEVNSVGEGIVWRCVTAGFENSGYWFKVKGEKHSAKSKVITLNPIDAERVDAIRDLAIVLTPPWRLEQMLQQTFDTLNGGLVDIKGTGDFVKAVMTDVLKECIIEIAESGFTAKDLGKSVGKISRDYLLAQLKF